MKIPLPGRSTALLAPILRKLLSCCAPSDHKDLVNAFVLRQDCLKVTLTTLCKIYQTAPKLSGKEQDAARQTHAKERPKVGMYVLNMLSLTIALRTF